MKKWTKGSIAFLVGLFAIGGVSAIKSNLVTQELHVISYNAGGNPLEKKDELTEDSKTYIPIYALKDLNVYFDMTKTSSVVKTYPIGSEIYAFGEKITPDNERFFVTDEGYIKHSDCTYNEENVFYPEERVFYATKNAPMYEAPNKDAIIVEYLSLNEEVAVSGYNKNNFYRVSEQSWLYVNIEDMMLEPYVEPEPDPNPEIIETTSTSNYTAPSGGGLTPSAGVYQGPSGKETYYNLDMSGVIAIAQGAGISGNYWVRSDGVKMYGDYVICACGFTVRPRGTIVETSLGTGICLDTGGFAENDPYQIDIAVNW